MRSLTKAWVASMTNISIGGGASSSINRAQNNIDRSSERISSGLRINSAADDAAGLAISNRLSAQGSEFSQSIRNASDGISLAQTALGALSSVTENIQRLRELSLQAANGILNESDRKALNAEAGQLKAEISRVFESSEFNGVPLFSNDAEVNIQVGSGKEDAIAIQKTNLVEQLESINFASLNLSSAQGAQSALGTLDQLQEGLGAATTQFGASINRFTSTIDQLGSSLENSESARSRIQDADFAREASELASSRILLDVGIALQAQANQDRASVLNLLST